MATIRVSSTTGRLVADMRRITVKAPSDMTRVVNKNVRRGAGLSRGFAKKTAGRHGKNYPQAIGSEMTGPTTGEWGPDADDPGGQGGMSFEGGSRNQPAHNDLANAADIVAPRFADDVVNMVDGWFW